MDEDDAFIAALLADPDDDGPRLVYADWLDERGDPRGEYLRAAVALGRLEAAGPGGRPPTGRSRRAEIARLKARLGELQFEVGRAWLEAAHRGMVLSCNRTLGPACPGRWERLAPTGLPLARQCPVCLRAVALCRTGREADAARCRGLPLSLTAGAELA